MVAVIVITVTLVQLLSDCDAHLFMKLIAAIKAKLLEIISTLLLHVRPILAT